MEDDQHKRAAYCKGDVAFEEIFLAKPDQTIIHDFSAQAKAGQKVPLSVRLVLERPSLALLMKFYEVIKRAYQH